MDALISKGIKVYATLYHWDLPQHIEDQGGWLNRNTAYLFQDYADKITQALGNRVHSYATLNEPFAIASALRPWKNISFQCGSVKRTPAKAAFLQ